MAHNSKIEWCDDTWNPVRGCARVSSGCGGPGDHGGCYAEAMAARFSKSGQWGHGFAEMHGGKPRWTGKVELIESMLTLPLTWKVPRRIFVNSTSDLFHEALPDEAIDRVFAIMTLAPQHTFQILTKRSKRMQEYMTTPLQGPWAGRATRDGEPVTDVDWRMRGVVTDMLRDVPGQVLNRAVAFMDARDGGEGDGFFRRWPLQNVWLGTSIEDQPTADERIPDLLATPAAVRFVSCEPLLSGIDLSKWVHDKRREGLPSSGGDGLVRGASSRLDLATRSMDARRNTVAHLYSEAQSRDQQRAEGKIFEGDVRGWGGATKNQRASNRLDDSESSADPERASDQSHQRGHLRQSPEQSRTGYSSAKRSARSHVPQSEEKGSEGREEFISVCNRSASNPDTGDVVHEGHVSEGHSGGIRGHAIDRFGDCPPQELGSRGLDWIIVGGESGPHARPMHPDWARSVRHQCAAAGTAFFMKQLSGPQGRAIKDLCAFPEDLRIREMPNAG